MSITSIVRRLDRLEQDITPTGFDIVSILNEARLRCQRGERIEPTDWQARIEEHELALQGRLSRKDRLLTEKLLAASKRMQKLKR